ncbi:hypothetical protein SEA_RAVENCO17_59 [Gordonia phage RavenCo17]|nr:hypothetical protein SEA_RAVENCO17_59 [Gordonia phage RavenCo17]
MSDDVRADARRDLESDRAFLDGTSPFDAPGAGYRLNTWVRTRIPALLAELDRVATDLDIYVGLHESMRATFTLLNEEGRLDDFSCDELASDLNDGAFEENGREYRSRLDAALAAIQHVRAFGEGLRDAGHIDAIQWAHLDRVLRDGSGS